jgi:hypothetical protein
MQPVQIIGPMQQALSCGSIRAKDRTAQAFKGYFQNRASTFTPPIA